MLFSEFKAQQIEALKGARDGATNETRVPGLLDLLAAAKPLHVLEIGCFTGISTEVFLLHCASVTSVDCWGDVGIEAAFNERVSQYPHLIKIKGRSPEALRDLRWRDYDLCYIDGDHSYEAVKADIHQCMMLSKPGMWIGGHDYGWWAEPGVKPAVDEIFGKPDHVFCDTSWLVRMEN